jgi:hypothetical protein
MTAAQIFCSLEEPLSTVKGLGSDPTWPFATGVFAALFLKLEIPCAALSGDAISTFAFVNIFKRK